jgi:hypothetical protein
LRLTPCITNTTFAAGAKAAGLKYQTVIGFSGVPFSSRNRKLPFPAGSVALAFTTDVARHAIRERQAMNNFAKLILDPLMIKVNRR